MISLSFCTNKKSFVFYYLRSYFLPYRILYFHLHYTFNKEFSGVVSFSTKCRPGWLLFQHILILARMLVRTDLTNTELLSLRPWSLTVQPQNTNWRWKTISSCNKTDPLGGVSNLGSACPQTFSLESESDLYTFSLVANKSPEVFTFVRTLDNPQRKRYRV